MAPPNAAPRGAFKKINFTVYHSGGYTASRAAPRRAAPRNESMGKFIFHGAEFLTRGAARRSVGPHLNAGCLSTILGGKSCSSLFLFVFNDHLRKWSGLNFLASGLCKLF